MLKTSLDKLTLASPSPTKRKRGEAGANSPLKVEFHGPLKLEDDAQPTLKDKDELPVLDTNLSLPDAMSLAERVKRRRRG